MTMDRLGDLVNTTPALHAIRRHHPAACITVEVASGKEELLSGSDDVDRVWTTPRHRGWGGRIRQLLRIRSGQFHIAYLLEECNDKVFMAWLAGIPIRHGLFRSKYRNLYTTSIDVSDACQESLGNLRNLLNKVGMDTSDWTVRLPLSGEVRFRAHQALQNNGWDGNTALIGINIGASNPKRIWTAERFAEVVDAIVAINATPVLLGSCDDRRMAEAIKCLTVMPLLDIVGKTSAGSLAGVIDLCVALVTGDTGAMHIAAALGRPVVALYGPSNPHITGPACDHIIIVRAQDFGSDCLHSIPVSIVVNSISRIIASSAQSIQR